MASWAVSARVKRKMRMYAAEPLGLTGKEVAEKMLRDHGIYDVQVVSTPGFLTDHYNPATKTVNLSDDVYNSANVAAAAVAAHECGHAVQHAVAYAPLQLRTALVPVVNLSNRIFTWLILLGVFFWSFAGSPIVLMAAIVTYGLGTLFAFVTLPVEVNASERAVSWLQEAGITDRHTTEMASDALHSAAYTYVVAALASLAQLLYYLSLTRRD